MTEKEQQDLIAKQYQQEINKLKQQELEERNKHKKMQSDYYKQLNNQLKEKQKKNTYSVLMSEYERSVNNNDIKAYQNMDTEHLFAKIPGFNPSNPQERYIDKAMNINTPNKYGAKAKGGLKPSLSYDNAHSKSGVGLRDNKLQSAAIQSFENFGDGKGLKLMIHELNYSPNKIERVRQNMEKEDAIKYRANTNNKGYGFEQRIRGHSPPAQPKGDGLYEYNFRAPGNY